MKAARDDDQFITFSQHRAKILPIILLSTHPRSNAPTAKAALARMNIACGAEDTVFNADFARIGSGIGYYDLHVFHCTRRFACSVR